VLIRDHRESIVIPISATILRIWKLLFAGNPGALVSPTFAESFAKGLKNCRVVQLGSGIHYLQEDDAEVIGAIVNEWLIDLGIGSSPKHKVAS
jgi:haloalkane dehalogenase